MCRQNHGGRKPEVKGPFIEVFLLVIETNILRDSLHFRLLATDLVPFPDHDLLGAIVRGQGGLSTHDKNPLSLVVAVVVKVEFATFRGILGSNVNKESKSW